MITRVNNLKAKYLAFPKISKIIQNKFIYYIKQKIRSFLVIKNNS